MNKSESKYFNTAKLMDEALIHLLAKKNIQYITVKEICELAGVHRSTFYLHYETINDLLNEALSYTQEAFDESFKEHHFEFADNISDAPLEKLIFINKDYLVPYLEFIKNNKHIYKAAVNNPNSMDADSQLSYMYKEILSPILTRFGIPKKKQKYILAYHIHGLLAIVQEWLKCDCSESVDELSQIIEDCVRPKL